jgi:hypothetical protein
VYGAAPHLLFNPKIRGINNWSHPGFAAVS